MLYNPDGSKRTNTPLDGEVFYDSAASGIVKWMFDGQLGQWFRITNLAHSAGTPNSNAFVPPGMAAPVFIATPSNWNFQGADFGIDWADIQPVKAKCECGSDKCGHPSHSEWCPRFQANL